MCQEGLRLKGVEEAAEHTAGPPDHEPPNPEAEVEVHTRCEYVDAKAMLRGAKAGCGRS